MLKNYLYISIRRLLKEKVFALINTIGLAVGIAFFLLSALFVRDELTFDHFHRKAENIYRMHSQVRSTFNVITPAWIGNVVKEQLPQVEEVANIGWSGEATIRKADELFVEEGFAKADPTIFRVFDFPLQQGVDSLALMRPNTMVISQAMAQKYFAGESPMGKTIELADGSSYEITGVLQEIPANSSFQFHFLATTTTNDPEKDNSVGNLYVLTKPGYTQENISADVQSIIDANEEKQDYVFYAFEIDPLRDLHLYATYKPSYGDGISGDIRYVYIFSTIGILILLVACINYVNLSTARATERAKEVGVRKVIGARKRQLILQFIGESVFLVTFAVLLAGVLVELLLPFLNEIAGKSLEMHYFSDPYLLPFIALLIPALSVFTGFYPALVLSSFQPVKVLKGQLFQSKANTVFSLRKVLVVLQFSVSSALVISTFIIWQQLNLIRTANLGFQKENVLVIQNPVEKFKEHEILKSKLLQLPSVVGVSAAPLPDISDGWLINSDSTKNADPDLMILGFNVDEDFIDLLGVTVSQGRPFDKNLPSDFKNAVILNQEAVEVFHLKDPIGAQVRALNDEGKMEDKTVIGVLNDFHYRSFKWDEKPTIIRLSKSRLKHVLVKIYGERTAQAVEEIQKIWKEVSPDLAFEYRFLDDTYEQMYQQDIRLGKIFTLFAIITIFIACLGLLGLTSYMTQKRTKEIGIRKVLGASVAQIVVLLSKDFTKIILLAFLIAIPIAWYSIQQWLQDFTYKIEMSLGIFLITGTVMIGLSWLTVGFQSVRAAINNPVDALRDE